ncbi:hypothetical protein KKE19_01860 [Patescibacteria group bacterium]|nr:hypothetical protein [Patescibacteria group bacterium]MBU4367443.1 hypothetical protein [Patescibacteria group bacterium]MBU4461763.1 hypothetical protein [Patescibacteria group bacterium]MCG2700147.1 hypothetical protein [Candidatus Parcubacteria bacterium]
MKKNERPPEGTVRPEKVAKAKRRIAADFYDQPVVIKTAVREMLKDLKNKVA